MDPLIVNIVLYFIFSVWYWRKFHVTSATFILIIMYLVFAINAYLLWYFGDYKWRPYQKREITVWPYLYTFIGFLIFMMPILKGKIQSGFEILALSAKKANILYWGFVFELLLGAFLNFSHATSVTDFTDVYHSDANVSPGIAGQLRIISAAVYLPALTLIGYYCSDVMYNWKRALVLLFSYFFNNIIEAMTCGSRGVLFFAFLNVVVLFFIFRKNMNARIKVMIASGIICSFFIFWGIIWAISYDRFGDEAWNWIFSYFGEPFLNIAVYYWDAPFTTGGALTLAPFTEIKYYDHNYMMILFKMFSGQSWLDFGLLGGIVFILVISSILYSLMPSKKQIPFNKAMIVIYAFYHCMFGIFGIRVYGWSAYALLIILYFYTRPSNETYKCV